jgi:hypothetical protein
LTKIGVEVELGTDISYILDSEEMLTLRDVGGWDSVLEAFDSLVESLDQGSTRLVESDDVQSVVSFLPQLINTVVKIRKTHLEPLSESLQAHSDRLNLHAMPFSCLEILLVESKSIKDQGRSCRRDETH